MSSLRGQSVLSNPESRPVRRDSKKFGLLKRWILHGTSLRRLQNHTLNDDNYNASRNRTHSNGTASMASFPSYTSLDVIDNVEAHDPQHKNCNIRKKQMTKHSSSRHELLLQASSYSAPTNVMQWMQTDCPKDVLPLVLAFAGPQQIAVIGRVNRFWNQTVKREATWRRLCEELYKWREGEKIPTSWKKHYQYNPCVPIDYSTIHNALKKVVRLAKGDTHSESSSVRVFLRPGIYVLQNSITIGKGHIDETDRPVSIAIETMEYNPKNGYSCDLNHRNTLFRTSSNQSKRKRKQSFRKIFNCRTVDVECDDEDSVDHESLHEYFSNSSPFSETAPIDGNESIVQSEDPFDNSTNGNSIINGKRKINRLVTNRAALVLKSGHEDKPLICVKQGSCTIRNIDLKHDSKGNDIWGGNAAIQMQPPLGPNAEPLDVSASTVFLDCVDITSFSGRGVVNIDGGHLRMNRCYVHDCAATGIYVGGSKSSAAIEDTDVVVNGKGNKRHRYGIGVGHSGLYLESGHATITNCNISRNVLTGISAISPENAVLVLQGSDLVSNGTFQLEMPAIGTAAYRKSVVVDNNLASNGAGNPRSGLF